MLKHHKDILTRAALPDKPGFRDLPTDIKQQMLSNTLYVRLADLLAAVCNRDAVQAMHEVASLLGVKHRAGELDADQPAQAHIAAAFQELARDGFGLDDGQLHAFAVHLHCLRFPSRDMPAADGFAAHAAAEQSCKATGGGRAEWRMHTCGLRTMLGSFSGSLEAAKVPVSFDDGSAANLISKQCLMEARDSLLKPYAPLLAQRPETAPGILALETPVKVATFSGSTQNAYYVVQAHLKLAFAVYPVRFLLVTKLPNGGCFLGLNFLWEYQKPLPPMMRVKERPEWVITRLTLGVPLGQGVSYPGYIAKLDAVQGKRPHEAVYAQVLILEPRHGVSTLRGRMVPAADAVGFVEEHLPKMY